MTSLPLTRRSRTAPRRAQSRGIEGWRHELRCVVRVFVVAMTLCVSSSVRGDAENVYRIVLASFPTEAQAQLFGDDIRTRMAQSPEIARAALDSGMWFRVAVGAYDTREAAEAALAVFEQRGMRGWIAAEPRNLATGSETQAKIATEGLSPQANAPVMPARPPEPVEAEDADAIAERLAELAPGPAAASNEPTLTASRPLGLLAAVRLALERAVPRERSETVARAPVTLAQVLDADDATSRDHVEQLLRAAGARGQEGSVLDTVLATSAAYLNVQRAEALLEIERRNLTLSNANHERARSRVEPGGANRAELYRWQTTRANAQARVANADAAVQRARIELIRTMNEPLNDQNLAMTPALDDPYFLVTAPAIRDAFASPAARPRLREFFVNEALRGSPELERLRGEIDARARRLTSADRATLPKVSASAGLERELRRNGAVDDVLGFESAERSRFQALRASGAEASLPLDTRDRRAGARSYAHAELDELTLEYDQASKAVRARVLEQTFAAEATFDAMDYTRTAAEAERKKLDRAMAAYDHGTTPVIDVTDAQAASLVSEQSAANALYDFLIDYLRLERLTGQFDLAATTADRDARRLHLEEALR